MTLAFSLFLDGSKLDERKVKVELTGLKPSSKVGDDILDYTRLDCVVFIVRLFREQRGDNYDNCDLSQSAVLGYCSVVSTP